MTNAADWAWYADGVAGAFAFTVAPVRARWHRRHSRDYVIDIEVVDRQDGIADD